MSDYPMLISNKLHSFRNFGMQNYFFTRLLSVLFRFSLCKVFYKFAYKICTSLLGNSFAFF